LGVDYGVVVRGTKSALGIGFVVGTVWLVSRHALESFPVHVHIDIRVLRSRVGCNVFDAVGDVEGRFIEVGPGLSIERDLGRKWFILRYQFHFFDHTLNLIIRDQNRVAKVVSDSALDILQTGGVKHVLSVEGDEPLAFRGALRWGN